MPHFLTGTRAGIGDDAHAHTPAPEPVQHLPGLREELVALQPGHVPQLLRTLLQAVCDALLFQQFPVVAPPEADLLLDGFLLKIVEFVKKYT